MEGQPRQHHAIANSLAIVKRRIRASWFNDGESRDSPAAVVTILILTISPFTSDKISHDLLVTFLSFFISSFDLIFLSSLEKWFLVPQDNKCRSENKEKRKFLYHKMRNILLRMYNPNQKFHLNTILVLCDMTNIWNQLQIKLSCLQYNIAKKLFKKLAKKSN